MEPTLKHDIQTEEEPIRQTPVEESPRLSLDCGDKVEKRYKESVLKMALKYHPVENSEPYWQAGDKRTLLLLDWLIMLGLGLLAVVILLALI